jgi:hypothetical protein
LSKLKKTAYAKSGSAAVDALVTLVGAGVKF